MGHAGKSALPDGPRHTRHEAGRQRRARWHQDGCEQRAQRPHEHGVGRIAFHVIHLRDEHDGGAIKGDAAEHCRLREGAELAAKEAEGGAIAAPQAGKQQRQAGELGHGRPVGGDEAHGGAAEEHGAEHGEDGSNAQRGSAGGKLGPNGRSARLAYPAGRLPARKIALDPMAVPGHGARPSTHIPACGRFN